VQNSHCSTAKPMLLYCNSKIHSFSVDFRIALELLWW